MAKICKKEYYDTWERFILLIEQKKFNDSFVNQKEFEETKKKLLEMVRSMEIECSWAVRSTIVEAEKNGIEVDRYYKHQRIMESMEKLISLEEKLHYQCENITIFDYENTYFKSDNTWIIRGLLCVLCLVLFYIWLKS